MKMSWLLMRSWTFWDTLSDSAGSADVHTNPSGLKVLSQVRMVLTFASSEGKKLLATKAVNFGIRLYQCSTSVKKIYSILPIPAVLCSIRALISRLRSEEHTSELQSLRHLVCRL